jgi:hypothetical protein
MANEARLHHYIPQFYLRGFGRSTSKNSKVTVIDLERERQYETAVKNVGAERDFNRVDVEGVAPDALERAYSGFEDKVAQSVRRIDSTLRFEGDDRIHVLNLIALMAVRHPQMRTQWTGFHAQLARIIMAQVLATKERWETTKAQMKAAGEPINESLTYEKMKEGWEGNHYEVAVPVAHHVRMERVGFEAILPTLVDRKWRMIVATEHSGPFVTCNHPVTLIWKNPASVPTMMQRSVGYGMHQTQLVFALTQRLALIGEFEGQTEAVLPATRELVAIINTRMVMFASQLYAPKLSFYYRDAGRAISLGATLLAEHLRMKREAATGGAVNRV